MVVLLWVLVGLAVGVWWLRGGWVLPTLMTIGVFFLLGGPNAFVFAPLFFMCVGGLIWLPALVWAMIGRTPRPIVGPMRAMVGVERQ